MKKFWIIVLIVVLVSMVGFLTNILILAISSNNDMMEWGSLEKMSDNIKKEEKYDLKDVNNLKLDFKSSDINVVVTDDEELRVVQYSNRELKNEQLFKSDKSNGRLTIKEAKMGYGFVFNIFNMYRVTYDIYIPKTYANNLEIASVSGDIEFNEELNLNKLDISLTSGDIKINNKLVANEIKIETISGDIELEKTESNKIQLNSTSGKIEVNSIKNEAYMKTISGDISIQELEGKVNAKTTSGEIYIHKLKMNGDSELNSTSGNIEVSLTDDSNCTITTKTTSGNVKLPNDKNTVGTENNNKLKLETTSGNIKIH